MSLLNSLFSGVSGMKNHQSMMDVVGNNISNVNTVGFKGSRVTFSDTFNQFIRYGSDPVGTNGGTNTYQVGLGMKLASVDRNWTQGTFERTGITTDLALQGDGLFIMENNGERFYSRAGAFSFDADGNLVSTSTGAVVQGKMATEEGVVPAGNNLESIKINLNQTVPAVKTSEVKWVGNLNSQATITRSEVAVQSGNISSTLGSGNNTSVDKSTIYDEDGNAYTLEVYYTGTAAATDYTMHYKVVDSEGTEVVAADTADLVFDGSGALSTIDTGSGAATPTATSLTLSDGDGINFNLDIRSLTSLASTTRLSTNVDTGRDATKIDGTVTVFDSLGEAHAITVSFTKTAANTWNWTANTPAEDGTLADNSGTITFSSDGSLQTITPAEPVIQLTPATAGGAESQSIKLDFGELLGFNGVTQTSSDSVVSVKEQDGSAAASLTNVNIDQYGNIIGVFSNGTTRALAQIMVATFPNNNGLISIGDNMYQVSANSGSVLVSDPGESSSTTIQSGALEQSNVDLSEEFTKMIIAQRGFQANARVITTSDSLLQEITNLVR